MLRKERLTNRMWNLWGCLTSRNGSNCRKRSGRRRKDWPVCSCHESRLKRSPSTQRTQRERDWRLRAKLSSGQRWVEDIIDRIRTNHEHIFCGNIYLIESIHEKTKTTQCDWKYQDLISPPAYLKISCLFLSLSTHNKILRNPINFEKIVRAISFS